MTTLNIIWLCANALLFAGLIALLIKTARKNADLAKREAELNDAEYEKKIYAAIEGGENVHRFRTSMNEETYQARGREDAIAKLRKRLMYKIGWRLMDTYNDSIVESQVLVNGRPKRRLELNLCVKPIQPNEEEAE